MTCHIQPFEGLGIGDQHDIFGLHTSILKPAYLHIWVLNIWLGNPPLWTASPPQSLFSKKELEVPEEVTSEVSGQLVSKVSARPTLRAAAATRLANQSYPARAVPPSSFT